SEKEGIGRFTCFGFALGQDTAHPQRATKGLDSTIHASLPMLIFRQDEFKEGLECAVCLCELVEGDKVSCFLNVTKVSTLVAFICGFNHTPLVLFVETPLLLVVNSGGACLEEGASASSSSNGSSAMAPTSGRQEGMLMIDVPTNGNENSPEEESRCEMPTRLRLKKCKFLNLFRVTLSKLN
ncbi:hypothetical protein Goklo_006649, partial [Gossypium klotzschianum]|nr:hypothetical protein [Gossypium klotzschianum]